MNWHLIQYCKGQDGSKRIRSRFMFRTRDGKMKTDKKLCIERESYPREDFVE